jgi:hypothetical protein
MCNPYLSQGSLGKLIVKLLAEFVGLLPVLRVNDLIEDLDSVTKTSLMLVGHL